MSEATEFPRLQLINPIGFPVDSHEDDAKIPVILMPFKVGYGRPTIEIGHRSVGIRTRA